MTDDPGPTKKVIIKKRAFVTKRKEPIKAKIVSAKKSAAAPAPAPDENAEADAPEEKKEAPAVRKTIAVKKTFITKKKPTVIKKVASKVADIAPPPETEKPKGKKAEAKKDDKPEAAKPEIFRFPCAGCGEDIPARKDRVGQEMACSVCDHKQTIPSPEGAPPKKEEAAPAVKKQAKPKEEPEKEAPKEEPVTVEPIAQPKAFKFYCIYCGQKLAANETHVGKTCLCPTCKNELEIPAPKTVPDFE